MKNKRGKVVTKKQHAIGKALFKKTGQRWLEASMTARKELGVKGFCAIGGKSAQGKALYMPRPSRCTRLESRINGHRIAPAFVVVHGACAPRTRRACRCH
ncbi:unnamed protein product [Symbiodinium sp. CCMP2592]|nr:unnamed protein product [Symbiodinium sp. CCMP2592]